MLTIIYDNDVLGTIQKLKQLIKEIIDNMTLFWKP